MRHGALCVATMAFGIGLLLAASANAENDDVARFDYLLNCAGCHKPDAAGSASVPALTDLRLVFSADAGRGYLVRVPGVAQAPLSNARLAALLNWILADLNGMTDFVPYAEDEVAVLRRDPLRAPEKERQRLLGMDRE